MTRKEIIYGTFIELFQWMDASDVEQLDSMLSNDIVLRLKSEKLRPTKANVISAISKEILSKIGLGIAEEKCPTDGFLSIQADLIKNKWINTTTLLRFIMKWKKKGYFDPIYPESFFDSIRKAKEKKDAQWLLSIKVYLVESIVRQCIISKEMRIDLQRSFGQFDGAQICENCGNIMWDGYSWDGTTYCDENCVMEGEGIDRKDMNEYLKDACDPDGRCYYTEWH